MPLIGLTKSQAVRLGRVADVVEGKSTSLVKRGPTPPVPSDRCRLVKVVAATGTAGKYSGKWMLPKATDISSDGSVGASDVGDEGGDCLIIDFGAQGATENALTVGYYYPGFILKHNDDGKPVVAVFGLGFEDCSG